jgi:hypothetical protein
MLSVLVVATAAEEAADLTTRHPSVEILHARGLEDALEKLGRNRRIDAVLLAAGLENREIARAILQDNPASPPLFAGGRSTPPGVRSLPDGAIAELLDRLVGELQS